MPVPKPRLCVDCRWHEFDINSATHMCLAPELPVDPVTGARGGKCDLMRRGGPCGLGGSMWLPPELAVPPMPEPPKAA